MAGVYRMTPEDVEDIQYHHARQSLETQISLSSQSLILFKVICYNLCKTIAVRSQNTLQII